MSQVRKITEAPDHLRGLVESSKALYILGGKHRLVDNFYTRRKPGDIVARQVLVTGDAEVDVFGRVEVVAIGRSVVRVPDVARRGSWTAGVLATDQSRVDITDGEVVAWEKAHVIARGTARVYVEGGEPTIEAHGETIVFVASGARPTIILCDEAVVVRRVARADGETRRELLQAA